LFDRLTHAIHTSLMNGKINIDYLFKAAFEDFEAQPSPEMLDNILGDAFDTSVQSSFEDFTLAPSIHIWDNINDAIPTEADKLLSTSFDELAVTPPANLWENISQSIPSETDQLFSASFDEFEVAPPVNLWENISGAIPSEVEQLLVGSFDEFEVTPPAGMWASIQGELDVEEHFDAKFQEAFSGFAPKPSEHILNNLLSNKFDTGVRRAFMRHEVSPQEAVWDRIKPYIRFGPTIQRHIPTLRRVAAVIVCLLMFAFLHDQFDTSIIDLVRNQTKTESTTTDNPPAIPTPTPVEQQPLQSIYEDTATERIVSAESQPTNREVVEESAEIDQQSISQSPSVSIERSRFDLGGTPLPPVSEESDKVILRPPTFTESVPTEHELIDNLISSISNIKVLELESYTPSTIVSKPDMSDWELLDVTTAFKGTGNEFAAKTSNLIDMDEDSDLARMMLNYKGWYVSSSLALYNSWILNDEVREGLSDQNPVDYVVDSGNSFGLGVGYQFTSNFGIEAEILASRLSQNYRELTNLNVFNGRSAQANYLYVPLSFKYQTRRLNSMNKRVPTTLSVVLGTHYGKLQNTPKLSSNRDIESGTEDHFIQQELGVFTGLDYHFYVNPNMHLTLGARAAAGTDFEYLSAPFAAGTPYNVQVGARVGINYRFATRQYKWKHGIY